MSKPEHDRTIDYIEFGATDIEATKRLYAACFGWKFTEYGLDYVASEGGRRFHLLDPNGNELAVWSGTLQNRAEVGGS